MYVDTRLISHHLEYFAMLYMYLSMVSFKPRSQKEQANNARKWSAFCVNRRDTRVAFDLSGSRFKFVFFFYVDAALHNVH